MNKYANLYSSVFGDVLQKLAYPNSSPTALASTPNREHPYAGNNIVEGASNFLYNLPGSTYNALTGSGTLGIPKVPLTKPDFRSGQTAIMQQKDPGTGKVTNTPTTVRDNSPFAGKINQAKENPGGWGWKSTGASAPIPGPQPAASASPSIAAPPSITDTISGLGLQNAGPLTQHRQNQQDISNANTASSMGLQNAPALASRAAGGGAPAPGGNTSLTGINPQTNHPSMSGPSGPSDEFLAKTMGVKGPGALNLEKSSLNRRKADAIRKIYQPGMTSNDIYAHPDYKSIS
jgi:hypothetical protein